jgi:diadenosine tetraphosphate (Ap4A) HIT family hydrolase
VNTEQSPFLSVPRDEWIAANGEAFAIAYATPVAPGHTLVVPRRPIVTWWEATAAERAALPQLVDAVKLHLDETQRPGGYNLGFNSGVAGGPDGEPLPHPRDPSAHGRRR